MRKVVWALALALVVSSLPAVSFAADIPCDQQAQQEDTFLNSLAQQVQEPAAPALAEATPKPLPAGSCINLNCWRDSDCWPHCGGEFGSYCSANHWCTPY